MLKKIDIEEENFKKLHKIFCSLVDGNKNKLSELAIMKLINLSNLQNYNLKINSISLKLNLMFSKNYLEFFMKNQENNFETKYFLIFLFL